MYTMQITLFGIISDKSDVAKYTRIAVFKLQVNKVIGIITDDNIKNANLLVGIKEERYKKIKPAAVNNPPLAMFLAFILLVPPYH